MRKTSSRNFHVVVVAMLGVVFLCVATTGCTQYGGAPATGGSIEREGSGEDDKVGRLKSGAALES